MPRQKIKKADTSESQATYIYIERESIGKPPLPKIYFYNSAISKHYFVVIVKSSCCYSEEQYDVIPFF